MTYSYISKILSPHLAILVLYMRVHEAERARERARERERERAGQGEGEGRERGREGEKEREGSNNMSPRHPKVPLVLLSIRTFLNYRRTLSE